jgi:hypothetical protein
MEAQKRKDIWDKITAVSALIASVLVPIMLAVVGQALRLSGSASARLPG